MELLTRLVKTYGIKRDWDEISNILQNRHTSSACKHKYNDIQRKERKIEAKGEVLKPLKRLTVEKDQ